MGMLVKLPGRARRRRPARHGPELERRAETSSDTVTDTASGRRLELHQRLIPARGLRGEPGRGGGPGLKIDSESPVTRDSEPGCLPLSDWQAQAEPLSRSRLGAASAPDSEPTVGQCAGAGPGCQ